MIDTYGVDHLDFDIDPLRKDDLLSGRDAIAATLRYAAEIASICARYKTVVLKPHPLPDEPHSLLLEAARQPNASGVIGDNTYRMLSLPEVSAVLTVNSSIGPLIVRPLALIAAT